jgi:hypothetical protein
MPQKMRLGRDLLGRNSTNDIGNAAKAFVDVLRLCNAYRICGSQRLRSSQVDHIQHAKKRLRRNCGCGFAGRPTSVPRSDFKLKRCGCKGNKEKGRACYLKNAVRT